MKKIIVISVFALLSSTLFAQKFITKNGHIRFYSETPMETIEADNKQVNVAYDYTSGRIVFKVLMKSFEFEKALMQEHFNENYVESDEFPNALFKGEVVNNDQIDLNKEGEIAVQVKGQLTIHGVTQEVMADGVMKIQKSLISAEATMMIKPADYNIKIPGAVVKNIAEEIEVFVNIDLKELSK